MESEEPILRFGRPCIFKREADKSCTVVWAACLGSLKVAHDSIEAGDGLDALLGIGKLGGALGAKVNQALKGRLMAWGCHGERTDELGRDGKRLEKMEQLQKMERLENRPKLYEGDAGHAGQSIET